MAIQFRLPDVTREKYGVASEWVTYDLDVMSLSEAIALEDHLGWFVDELQERLAGRPVLDTTGEPVLDDNGKPKRKRDMRAWKFAIWAAIARTGVDVDFDEFDLNLVDLLITSDSAAPADPKEAAAETADPSTPEKPNGDSKAASEI